MQTKELQDEERYEKMTELAEQIYERLGIAIEELEKDLEYDPQRFFGIAMWPDTIWSTVTTFATLTAGFLVQDYMAIKEGE